MPYNERLAARIEARLDKSHPAHYTSKKMFGGVTYMLNGNMACGVHKGLMIVRVGLEAYMDALNRTGARPFDLTGRPMKGWVSVTEAGFERDEDLEEWIRMGVQFASSLPAK